ncbi:MAG: hypothetical protein BWY52_00333 [Chloroflexi bacterium ADurb.Bin325]|nr:MAG: hypothetical protein BWY52_00333 [Chloroflexi bacterium ADurb.Bin325]
MSQEDETALVPAARPRGEVLPAAPRLSRLWPLAGAALIWAARELLPEILAAWQAARSRTVQPVGLTPDAAAPLPPADRGGYRFRRGRGRS